MAAGAWTFYKKAKKHLADGILDMDTNSFRMMLCTSASNAATVTLSAKSGVTGEVTEAFGYSSSGKPLAGVTWTAGASAGVIRFNCSPVVWSAVGGDITSIKYAVIYQNGASAGLRKLLCFSQLSTAQFTVTSGNTLTITPSANGIFELT